MLGPIRAPRDGLDDDARAVREAAARLRIPEFAIFHLAYRRWFGERASDAMLERRFMAFLYGRRVPVWVRQGATRAHRLRAYQRRIRRPSATS